MEKRDPLEVINLLLQTVPSDKEETVIKNAGVTAGFLWRCENPQTEAVLGPFGVCGFVNTGDDEECLSCKAKRPENATPQQTIHVTWHGVTLCGRSLETTKHVPLKDLKKATCEVCICRVESYS